MGRLLWLPTVLREAGLGVIELPGWQSRETRPGFEPVGIVCHHTASSRSASDEAVRRLLRDGRPDLPGPLSQLGLERDGTYVVVAAGRCNHNGVAPMWGNDSIGIEAYNDGVGEPWHPAQIDAYHRGVAAICRRMGWSIAQVRGHKETDRGRKIDPTLDMDQFRADVGPLISAPPAPTPHPPMSEEDDMFTYTYDAPGAAPNVLVLVAGGKQIRLTGAQLLATREKAADSHLGAVDADEAARFVKAFGPVIT